MTPESDTFPGDTSTNPGVTVTAERLILLTVTLGIILAPLNSTMIAVALPSVMAEFGVGISSAGWLVTAYLIAMASLQPLAGKLGDRFGYRRMLLGGLGVFGFASIAAAISPTLMLLLAFRVSQAICAALIVPNGSALIRQILPEHRRGAGFGAMGAGIAIAAAAGPPLGGLLVEFTGWRAIFYVNLFIVVPSLLIGLRCLPTDQFKAARSHFDLFGALLLPTVLIATAWILISFSKGSNFLIVVVGIPAVFLGVITLGWYERRHQDPIFQLEFFHRKSFSAAAVGIGFSNLAMYSLLISIPLLLSSREQSPLHIGLILTAMSAGMTVSSFWGGRLIDRFGRRFPTTSGLALLTIGTMPIALGGVHVSSAPLIIGLTLVGLGLGLATPGLQTSAVESVHSSQAGSASGLYSTSRYLGSIIGSAIIAGILGANRTNVDAIGIVFLISLGGALIAALSSLGLSHNPAKALD